MRAHTRAHARMLVQDVVQRQWEVIRQPPARRPPSGHKTTDELPHPHAQAGTRGVGGGEGMQRQLRKTMSRRLSFDGTDQPSSRSNSVFLPAAALPRCAHTFASTI